MSNITVASNVWINVSDPEGLGNNHHMASLHLPGDLAVKLIVGNRDVRSINHAILERRLTKRQHREFLTYRFFMPHTHEGDSFVHPDF